jgi:ABC-2 type transport system ATP-binding protein
LTRRQIDANFDSIVDFAGVREFIDTPVRNYSSGMYVRLGFAVAVHVDPDILLIDEVLSVGDAAFQEKSLARMRAFRQRGKTLVLVSHDLSAVASLCERTVVLDHGRVAYDGPTQDAIQYYELLVHSGQPAPEPEPEPEIEGRTGDFRAKVVDARLTASGRNVGDPVPSGQRVSLELEVEALADLTADGSITVGLNLRRPDMDLYVYETRTSWRGTYFAPPKPGCRARVSFELDLRLLSGTYLVDLLVANASSNVIHDRWRGALQFRVRSPEHEFGVAALDARISVWNPDGFWPAHLHAPPLERGGPREHPLREGEPAPAQPHVDAT